VAIGDGRFKDPVMVNSQGTTRIVFGTTPSRVHKDDPNLDHNSELGPVFVNDLALQALTGNTKIFPVGSILVREKPGKSTDATPEVLAVMIKRESGFNPDGGDWQFLLANGSRTKVKLSQKTGDCLSCHQSQAKADFVHPLKLTKTIVANGN